MIVAAPHAVMRFSFGYIENRPDSMGRGEKNSINSNGELGHGM